MSAVDFTQKITDAYGETVMAGEDKPLTVGRACVTALCQGLPGEDKESGEKKFERFMLSQKIAAAEEAGRSLDLSAKETVLIKDRVAAVFTRMEVIGRVWQAVEPEKEAA